MPKTPNNTPETMNMGNLLKIRDACEALSVNEKTLRDMIARGTIKAVRLGPKTTRVVEESIDALISGPTKFDRARKAIYSELNAAFDDADFDRARKANEANKMLSCAKDDTDNGAIELARYSADRALALLPGCPELLEYRWSL